MYIPLPESVTIKQRGINGLGLFADQDIKQGTHLGTTHIKVDDNIIRTPLGGFVNHNDEPNCRTVDIQGYKYLTALKNIEPGEELTLKYSMYNLDLVN